jgi:hypothetical protein
MRRDGSDKAQLYRFRSGTAVDDPKIARDESVSTALNQTRRLSLCLSLILSEDRFPLFRTML